MFCKRCTLAKRLPEEVWYKSVAERMVRDSLPFSQAAGEEGIALTKEDALRHFRSKTFQQVLWQSRFEYYNEISSNPGRTKAAVLGLMTLALEKLSAEQQWKEVLEGALKLARIEGWVGGDANVNVFANLTAEDIEAEKAKILAQIEGTSQLTAN
jgi:hypothetical protein